ncbi:hypothetical protein EV363DRAFT_1368760 [Boletus edulis]|nr:hypothetical protein EV363DRAFT_1368760 [Boletus edulis]
MGNSEKIATRSTLPMYRASHEPKLQAYPVTPGALCTFKSPHLPRFRVVARRGVWGIITDSRGKSLDFGLGRSHGENYGFIAASKDVHGQVLAGVQQALAEVGRR